MPLWIAFVVLLVMMIFLSKNQGGEPNEAPGSTAPTAEEPGASITSRKDIRVFEPGEDRYFKYLDEYEQAGESGGDEGERIKEVIQGKLEQYEEDLGKQALGNPPDAEISGRSRRSLRNFPRSMRGCPYLPGMRWMPGMRTGQKRFKGLMRRLDGNGRRNENGSCKGIGSSHFFNRKICWISC